MKFIKKFNENRTIGFRYSDPTEMYVITFEADEEFKPELVEEILKYLDVAYDKVEFVEGDQSDYYKINLRVYSDKEIDNIIENLVRTSVRRKLFIIPESIRVIEEDY